MKTNVIVLLLLLTLLSSCSLLFRYAGGIKDPKVESKESIREYLQKIECPFEHTYVLKGSLDSTEFYDNLLLSMRSPTYMYDSSGVPLQYIGDASCSGTRMQQAFHSPDSFFRPATDDSINLFLLKEKFERIDGSIESDLPKADYYYVKYWGKYFQKKLHAKSEYIWMDTMNLNSKRNVVVLLVNTDMQETWGANRKGKIDIKLRTRKTEKGWSMKMNMKEKNIRQHDK